MSKAQISNYSTKINKKYSLIKNSYGYYEVMPKPDSKELQKHYSEKYYQNNHGSYQKKYSKEELKYFAVESELAIKTLKHYSINIKKKLLDLGCGEGFFAKHFKKKGWLVECVDYSKNGISTHNPSLLPNFIQSDFKAYLSSKENKLNDFGLINLDNVLEHVVDPIDLLKTIKKKINKKTIIRIEVPNDFSKFQSLLLKKKYTNKTWISVPEHLSYFNKNSLLKLFKKQGFKLISLQSDFAIEQFLLNKHSNYWKNKALGRGAHATRVIVTNYMADTNIDRLIDYREASADLEFGRLLTAYITI
tara:strand:+ start:266 stop:1177 length:912 start_codon:yes stop_codon:yes gene_type:complete